ncbi:MAG: hypothetical protein KKE11_00495 [Gammaproteobacteria bacterium]|nr:hypothetical protein [Gammaproteobacteria bacterium]
MLKFQRIIYSIITTYVLVVVLGSPSYAEEETIVLGCNDNRFGPIEYIYPGSQDTLQSLTLMGIQMKGGGQDKFFTRRYSEYSREELRALSKERRKVLRELDVSVSAKCSILSGNGIDMWPTIVQPGKLSRKTLGCGPKEGVTIYVYSPKCRKNRDQQVVFILTKTKIEDEEPTSNATYEGTDQEPKYYKYESGESFFSGEPVVIYWPRYSS